MNLKFVLRTLTAAAAWLVLQNFNAAAAGVHGATGKSMESPNFTNCQSNAVFPVPSPAYRIKKVVLDAGHGGKDPGCLGSLSKEKDNALAIVLKLGEMIKGAFPDVEVIYTRKTDVFIELNERAAIANRHKADLFISVHCNSIRASGVKGTETYVMGLHTAEHNLEVAKRENASIYLEDNYEKNYEGYDPDSPEAHIIGSVWQSAYLEQSILFAGFVQRFAKSTASREDKGVKQAGFLVLRETAMPAVLVESGYLTNRAEEEFVASEEGQAQLAQAIFEAFESYKYHMEGDAAAQTAQQNNKRTPPQAPVATYPAQQKNSGPLAANDASKSAKQIDNQFNKTPYSDAKPQTVSQPKGKVFKPNAPPDDAASKGPFRIFLLSWPVRMDRNAGQLGLIGDIKEEKTEGQYHYYTGHYATRAEAEKMLPEIRNLGFRTASIVPSK